MTMDVIWICNFDMWAEGCRQTIAQHWLFNDKTMFNVSWRVNTHNLILGNKHLHASYELDRAQPKVNIWGIHCSVPEHTWLQPTPLFYLGVYQKLCIYSICKTMGISATRLLMHLSKWLHKYWTTPTTTLLPNITSVVNAKAMLRKIIFLHALLCILYLCANLH
jgi:hypothetical protein